MNKHVVEYKNFNSSSYETVNFTDVSIIVALFENVQFTLNLYECIIFLNFFMVILSTGVKATLANDWSSPSVHKGTRYRYRGVHKSVIFIVKSRLNIQILYRATVCSVKLLS